MSSEINFEMVMGARNDTQLLYSINEKQFYTKHLISKQGTIFRCANHKKKQCLVKIIKKNDTECVKLNSADLHSHICSCEKEFHNLKAKQTMKTKAADLNFIGTDSRLTKSSDIYNIAMLKYIIFV